MATYLESEQKAMRIDYGKNSGLNGIITPIILKAIR